MSHPLSLFSARHFYEIERIDFHVLKEEQLGEALLNAIKTGNGIITEVILRSDSKISIEYLEGAFYEAAKLGNEKILRLISLLCSKLAIDKEEISSESFGSALWISLELDHSDLLVFFSENKDRLSQKDLSSAVMKTALLGKERELITLLSFGRDISLEDREFAIINAAIGCNEKILKILIHPIEVVSKELITKIVNNAIERKYSPVIFECFKKYIPFSEIEFSYFCVLTQAIIDLDNIEMAKICMKEVIDRSFRKEEFLQFHQKVIDLDWTFPQKNRLIIPLFFILNALISDESKIHLISLLKQHLTGFKDFRRIDLLINFLIHCKHLDPIEIQKILIGIFKIKDFSDLNVSLGICDALISLDQEKLIKLSVDEFNRATLQEKIISEFIEKKYLPEAGCDLFLRSRDPKAIFQYCALHRDERIKSLILKFTTWVANGSFRMERNRLNSHLFALNPIQTEHWENALENREINILGERKSYFLVDSDDPMDIFLCGTDVLGSCMRVDCNPSFNQCLLGYLLDGKSRLFAVKNPINGRLVSRAFLKIMIDKDRLAHLFFESVYGDYRFKDTLFEFASLKARKMGLSIHSLEDLNIKLYSTGNYSGIEYEDGCLSTTDGTYEIEPL